MAKKRSRAVIPRQAGDPRKHFPNGLKATIKSIRKSWPDTSGSPARTPLEFAQTKQFIERYNEIAKHYGEAPLEPSALSKVIEKLESNGDGSDINFWRIRAFAEYLGSLPTGLFLVFTQCVSDEARGLGREHLISFLSRAQESIAALKAHVEDTSPKSQFFILGTESEYSAELLGLSKMVEAFGGTTGRRS